jgi:hypothetical protein
LTNIFVFCSQAVHIQDAPSTSAALSSRRQSGRDRVLTAKGAALLEAALPRPPKTNQERQWAFRNRDSLAQKRPPASQAKAQRAYRAIRASRLLEPPPVPVLCTETNMCANASATCQSQTVVKQMRMKCSRCRIAVYCSVFCQEFHWGRQHKRTCSRRWPIAEVRAPPITSQAVPEAVTAQVPAIPEAPRAKSVNASSLTGPRECANVWCRTPTPFVHHDLDRYQCTRCQNIYYCSKECHQSYWLTDHHRTCIPK